MCGHGRALRFEVAEIVDGIEFSASGEADPSEGAVDGCDDEIGFRCSGESFVGLRFTKPAMRSGTLAGVTSSMNCQDGSSNTLELVSE